MAKINYKLNLGCGFRYHNDPSWENINYPGNPPMVKQVNLHHGLPYRDNTFEFIYTSHVLDHFDLSKVKFLLREILRCLKQEGVIRISVPNLEFNCQRYLQSIEDNASDPHRHHWFTIELIDQMTRTQHGGEKAEFLRAARTQPDVQAWLRPLLGYEMLQHLDRPESTPPRGMNWIKEQIRRLLYLRSFEKSGERHFWTFDWISLSDLLRRAGFANVTRQDFHRSLYQSFELENLDIQDGKEYKPGSLYVEGRKL